MQRLRPQAAQLCNSSPRCLRAAHICARFAASQQPHRRPAPTAGPPAAAAPAARLRCPAAAADAPPDAEAAEPNNLPRSPLEMVQQAAACVSAAVAAGQRRHAVELLLPVNEKERNFLATEADDYPCSLQKEFDVACSLTTSLLRRLLDDPEAAIAARRLDDGATGEPCAVLFPEGIHRGKLAAVVYPTADRLPQIRELAKEDARPLLLVNAQWREAGQVVSDFGIGPWRKAALDFLAQFLPTYSLKERRIGSPGTIDTVTGTRFGSGGVVRVLRRAPGRYEAYATSADGSSQMMASSEEEPSYEQLDSMITAGRKRQLPIFKIARLATYVYADDGPAGAGGGPAAPRVDPVAAAGGDAGGGGGLTESDIEALDAASLRRLLAAAGEPTSGKISRLRERLREVAAAQR